MWHGKMCIVLKTEQKERVSQSQWLTLKDSDPKSFWKMLDELGKFDSKQECLDNINADTWLNHFKKIE